MCKTIKANAAKFLIKRLSGVVLPKKAINGELQNGKRSKMARNKNKSYKGTLKALLKDSNTDF